MMLAERDHELAALESALHRAGRRQGSVVLVCGEAGIGKSSLVAAFTATTLGRAAVFCGTCEDLTTPRPLGPLRDMRRPANGGLDPGREPDRDAFVDALLDQMDFVTRPAVVVVEDLQWADGATLEVLRILARRIATLPALLVLTLREQDLGDDHVTWRLLGELPPGVTVRLQPAPLTDGTVAAMAAAAGLDPGPVVAAVAGNPFFLGEVLAGGGTGVPPSVRHAVMARISGLPEATRLAVQRLSVLTGRVGAELLERLDIDPGDLADAVRAGIVDATDDGIGFRHELARRAIETSLPGPRSVRHHRAALVGLAAVGAEPSRCVPHAVAVGDRAAIVEHAAAATAEAAAVDAHAEAAEFAELALAHLDDRTSAVAAGLHGAAAAARYAGNRFGAAAEHADSAVAIWEATPGQPLELGQALLISARLSTLMGHPRAARAKAARAVRELEPGGPSRQLVLGYSTLGAQEVVLGRYRDGLIWTGKALQVAKVVGAQDLVAHGLGYRGVARCVLGDPRGHADLDRAADDAVRFRRWDIATVTLHNAAVMRLRRADVAAAEAYLDRGMVIAREHNLDTSVFRIEAQRCQCLILRGDWDLAESRLLALLAADADAGTAAVNPLSFVGRIQLRRGDPTGRELIDRAWTLAQASGEDQKLAVAGAARLEMLWLTDDLDELRIEAERLLLITAVAGHHYLRGEVTRCLQRAGIEPDPDAGPTVPREGCPAPLAAGISGDWETAARLWAEAGMPYEQALELCAAPDQPAVRSGLAILDQLGAVVTGATVRRALRRRGVRGLPRGPRRSTSANPGRLTDRQLEVLRLLVDGRTNGQIAEQLVLSPRTVDKHVAGVLRVLGVGSRRDVAAAAARLGVPVRAG